MEEEEPKQQSKEGQSHNMKLGNEEPEKELNSAHLTNELNAVSTKQE